MTITTDLRYELLADDVRTASESPNPLTRLARLDNARRAAESLIAENVRQARELGASWQDIGAELCTSKQAAQQRYG